MEFYCQMYKGLYIILILLARLDAQVNFISHIIYNGGYDASGVTAADIDGDSDLDVFSASANDNKIAWYENDGSQNFKSYTITSDAIFAQSVFSIDIDGDGDMDVLSASKGNNNIVWYENQLVSSLVFKNPQKYQKSSHLAQNYPNPFNQTTNISFYVNENSNVKLKVYDINGRLISNLINQRLAADEYEVSFNSNNLSSGVYFYRIIMGEYLSTKKMILYK